MEVFHAVHCCMQSQLLVGWGFTFLQNDAYCVGVTNLHLILLLLHHSRLSLSVKTLLSTTTSGLCARSLPHRPRAD